jgi:hypothetical protein
LCTKVSRRNPQVPHRLDHLALTVPASDLAGWSRRLGDAGVDHSPPAPSAFGDTLIVFRDPDQIQLQIYGIETDGSTASSNSD